MRIDAFFMVRQHAGAYNCSQDSSTMETALRRHPPRAKASIGHSFGTVFLTDGWRLESEKYERAVIW